MNFFNLNLLTVGIGIAGLAGVLYLLQQLRIRYTELPVATTLFWAAAVREAPVRVLRQRFRHFLAYLLILLICSLMWIGFGGPTIDNQRSAGFNVLVLDGSAHAATADVFEESKRQLLNDVNQYARESREVFLSGEHNVRLLAAGEESLILERRLDEFEPVAAKSTIDELIRLLPRNAMYPDNVNVILYGRAPLSPETVAMLPEGFTVSRQGELDDEFENRGIVALGIGEAISGDWDKVDVLFRVLATDGVSVDVSDLTVKSGDLVISSERIESITANEYRILDVVADGSTFEVRIEQPDDLEFDNIAQVSLPLKERIRVFLGTDISSAIKIALEADAAIELVSEDADVSVLGPNDSPSTIPYLQAVTVDVQNSAFVIGYSGELSAEEALYRSVETLGLAQIDAVAMATELNTEIGIELLVQDTRFVSLWEDLVGDDFNFKDSLSFPLFMSKTIRYLAEEQPWYAYIAAGRQPYEQTANSSLAETDLLSQYAAGSYYVRNEAGAFETSEGNALHVSLLDASAALPAGPQDVVTTVTETTSAQSAWGLATWLILIVFILLGLEWYLYQRGLMP